MVTEFTAPEGPEPTGDDAPKAERDPIVGTAQVRVTLRHEQGSEATRPTLSDLESAIGEGVSSLLGEEYAVSVTGEWT